jgi:CRP-like cAMP-binding protein
MKTQIEDTQTSFRGMIVTHPFFKGINPRYIHLLTECASIVEFGALDEIFHEGEEADHFYLIRRGKVELNTFVPRVGTTTVQTIGPGDALGWSWLFPPYEWHLTARAVEPVEALAFDARSLRESAEENHDFGYDLVMRVGHVMFVRLQATRRRFVGFYTGE